MLTTLVWIHGILHSHIRTCNFIDYRFGENRDVLRPGCLSVLSFHPAEFKEIIPELMAVLLKSIGYMGLCAPAFNVLI
jgi:hypothetical protein